MLQLVVEDLRVFVAGEIAVLLAGRDVRVDHAIDELLETPLPLRRADGATEVLRRDDVGGIHRPEVGKLHPTLLEVHRAVAPVGHDDVAGLPGDLVVRVYAGLGVDPLDPQPLVSSRARRSPPGTPGADSFGHLSRSSSSATSVGGRGMPPE